MNHRTILAFFFILLTIIVYAQLHAVVGLYLAAAFGLHLGWLLWILGVSSVLSIILSRFSRTFFTTAYYWLGTTWMGVVFITSMVFFPFLIGHEFFATALYAYIAVPLVLLLTSIAFYNAAVPRIKKITLPLAKLKKPVTLVQLTDVHIGEIYNGPFLTRIVEHVNRMHPDIVVITGDLFDGGTLLHQGMIDPLKKLKPKALFVTGNHEVYEGAAKTKKLVRELGIRVLDDTTITLCGIQFTGISYQETFFHYKRTELAGLAKKLNKHQPAILLRHEPRDVGLAAAHGYALMLSGHTHNGQIWPLNYMIQLFYEYRTGLHKKHDMVLYIGPGLGTWGPALRLGSRSEITLFTLVPA